MNDSEEHKTGSGAGSVKKCHPECLFLWPDWETPSLSSPLHFNWHLPYLLLFNSTPCTHSQTYTTTVFSIPFKNPLYCKSCSVQSCWRPVNLPLLRQSITKVRTQYFLEDCDHLFCYRPHRERLLCDHKQYKQKQPAVTLLNASNFCYFYKSVFYQQLNEADADNIIYSLVFEELLFL